MPDVLYVHPAKHSVDAGYQDLGLYFSIPVGVIGLVNRLQRSGLSVKGIDYPAELMRDWSFKLMPWLKGQKGIRLVEVDFVIRGDAANAQPTLELLYRSAPSLRTSATYCFRAST